MSETQKTKDGILLLSVGLVAGFLSAACGFFIWYHNSEISSSVPTSAPIAVAADTSQNSAQAEVSTVAPAPEVNQPSALQIAAQAAAAQIPEGMVFQGYSEPASGLTGNTLTVSSSGSAHDYVSVNPVYADSPYWTVDRNGLIGNPPVDPASSKGRAYSY